jgi:hypothetical protein
MPLSVSRQYSIDKRVINKYGAVGGMRIGRGNRQLLPLRSSQVPHDLIWDRTKAAVRGSRRPSEGIRFTKEMLSVQTRVRYEFKSFVLVTPLSTFRLPYHSRTAQALLWADTCGTLRSTCRFLCDFLGSFPFLCSFPCLYFNHWFYSKEGYVYYLKKLHTVSSKKLLRPNRVTGEASVPILQMSLSRRAQINTHSWS